MENTSTLNNYALQLIEDWSKEDAYQWVTEITHEGTPESIDFRSAQLAAEESFKNNIGNNNFLKFSALQGEEAMQNIKDYYINFFVKKASKYLKDIRAKEQEERALFDKKIVDMGIQGHAAAARWFVMMENTKGINLIDNKTLREIASATFDCKYPAELHIDERLRQSFISFFTKEADMLLKVKFIK